MTNVPQLLATGSIHTGGGCMVDLVGVEDDQGRSILVSITDEVVIAQKANFTPWKDDQLGNEFYRLADEVDENDGENPNCVFFHYLTDDVDHDQFNWNLCGENRDESEGYFINFTDINKNGNMIIDFQSGYTLDINLCETCQETDPLGKGAKHTGAVCPDCEK